MNKNKIQTLNATLQERSLIVVAASGLPMADGFSQDPMRAKVRLRDGSMVYVKDLPSIDANNKQPNGDYSIPLISNHSDDVRDQAGSVWYFCENGRLHALVVFALNKSGQELWPLAEAGMLQYSTEGFVENISDDGRYGDFWLTGLAPVVYGNDPATELVENKNGKILVRNAFSMVQGDIMSDDKTDDVQDQSGNDDVETLKQKIAELEAQLAKTPEVPSEPEKVDNKVGSVPRPQTVNHKPVQTVTVDEDRGHDEEVKAFANALAQATRHRSGEAGVRAAMEVYYAKVGNDVKRENVLTGSDILPSQLATTFFKAWLDNENARFIRYVNARAGAVYAANLSVNPTALDHGKGDDKLDQTANLTRRDLKALALYKRLPIDAQDLFDDTTGELVRFRTQELSARIANQLLVAAVLGGNTPGSVGSSNGGGTRGLFGIIPDAEAVSGFGTYVASKVNGTAGEDPYAAVIRTINEIAVTTGGNITSAGLTSSGITLIVPTGWIADLLLTKNSSGNYQFTRDNINSLLGITSLVMMPELKPSGRIVAVADGAYQLYGENTPKIYPFFDTKKNQDILLAEQFVAGSLAGYKQASVYIPDSNS